MSADTMNTTEQRKALKMLRDLDKAGSILLDLAPVDGDTWAEMTRRGACGMSLDTTQQAVLDYMVACKPTLIMSLVETIKKYAKDV